MTDLMIGYRRPEALEKIELAIADHALISISDLRDGGRDHVFAEARQIVWTLGHDVLRIPYIRLARMYRKDHTTIMHGVRKIRTSGMTEKAKETVNKRFPGLLQEVDKVGKTIEKLGGRTGDGKGGQI